VPTSGPAVVEGVTGTSRHCLAEIELNRRVALGRGGTPNVPSCRPVGKTQQPQVSPRLGCFYGDDASSFPHIGTVTWASACHHRNCVHGVHPNESSIPQFPFE
jgi:hypothetical protein